MRFCHFVNFSVLVVFRVLSGPAPLHGVGALPTASANILLFLRAGAG